MAPATLTIQSNSKWHHCHLMYIVQSQHNTQIHWTIPNANTQRTA